MRPIDRLIGRYSFQGQSERPLLDQPAHSRRGVEPLDPFGGHIGVGRGEVLEIVSRIDDHLADAVGVIKRVGAGL